MKKHFLLILSILIMQFGCSSQTVNKSILNGFWVNVINDASGSQKFVLHFYQGNQGLECRFHSYFNGVKFNSEPGCDINFDGESISFIANKSANVVYEGKVDTIKGLIIGKLKYGDGSEREFDLKKISEDKLAVEFPGLYNLTKDSDVFVNPVKINDGWETETLLKAGIDSTLLQKMIDSINHGNFGKVHSVLIAKNGALAFEKYFDGFFINDLNSLQSCTKSIGSLLIGISIDKGFIRNVDEKVLDFFPDYKNNADKKWNEVELKHLLTMSTGLNWERNVIEKIYQTSDDVIRAVFEQKFSHEPGQIFEYINPQADLLSGIIKNSSKKSVQDFAGEYLFEPLGINEFSWNNYKKAAYPLMSGSLALTSRDMLKIGQLVLNKGKWDNKQIISSKWINESTTFKIKTNQAFDYGYLWWIGKSKVKPGLEGVFATGLGGQHIIIIPEMNTVIVTTADNTAEELDTLLRMVDDYIIKGIK